MLSTKTKFFIFFSKCSYLEGSEGEDDRFLSIPFGSEETFAFHEFGSFTASPKANDTKKARSILFFILVSRCNQLLQTMISCLKFLQGKTDDNDLYSVLAFCTLSMIS